MLCTPKGSPESPEGFRIGILSFHIAQKFHEPWEGYRVQTTTMGLYAVPGTFPEPLKAPAPPGYTDYWYIQTAIAHHALQRRKNLLERQIASGSIEYQSIGT
jgi:hypothetical protein